MNKAKFISLALFLSALIFTACYKSAESNIRTAQKSDKSFPSPEATVAPAAETDQSAVSKKSGDFDQALNYYNGKNYEKAAAEFQEVVKSNPQNHQAHFYLGKSFQALKKDDDAISAFKEALKIKPDDANTNFELGSVYYNQKKYESSLPFYEKAAKIESKSTEKMAALGDNYRMLKKPENAIVQYLKISAFEPQNADAYYKTGLIYLELNNKIAARQQHQKLASLDANLAKKLLDAIEK